MSNTKTPTLGQRIDEVLEPLYAEAEQHRATIALVKQQQQSLQEQLDDATQGLGEIESRMAEVVRSLAQQEPVIAAVCGQTAAAGATENTAAVTEAPVEPAAVIVEAEPEAEPETDAPVPEPQVETTAIEEAIEPEPAPVAQTPEPIDPPADGEPAIELDAVADAAAVDEAAALLDGPPEQEGEAEQEPKVDLAAAAERAAAAAKQLREKAASE